MKWLIVKFRAVQQAVPRLETISALDPLVPRKFYSAVLKEWISKSDLKKQNSPYNFVCCYIGTCRSWLARDSNSATSKRRDLAVYDETKIIHPS